MNSIKNEIGIIQTALENYVENNFESHKYDTECLYTEDGTACTEKVCEVKEIDDAWKKICTKLQ